MKKVFIVCICVLSILSCSACFDSNIPKKANTKWQSNDEVITFYVCEKGCFGTIRIENEEINILISFNASNYMSIYPDEIYYSDVLFNDFEKWKCDFETKKKFIATVEETTYFEVGQEITFNLIEENIDESEIPYPEKPDEIPQSSKYNFPY